MSDSERMSDSDSSHHFDEEDEKEARERWQTLINGGDARRQRRVERQLALSLVCSKEATERQMEVETKFYKAHFHSLKMSLARELNNDPRQYFEWLYEEFILWKKANRPPTMWSHMWLTTGISVLHDECNALHDLAIRLQTCVTDFEIALHEEDMLDEDTVGLYFTVEEQHEKGCFYFQSGMGLMEHFEAAGLYFKSLSLPAFNISLSRRASTSMQKPAAKKERYCLGSLTEAEMEIWYHQNNLPRKLSTHDVIVHRFTKGGRNRICWEYKPKPPPTPEETAELDHKLAQEKRER
ncbi:hypothetical protein V5O48_014523 [Marasmius crinis-equi]|uniref:Uncharacterized protein n=1 Tax=Marasmius crinis-equi TaxID=585013 RepID=A0ABR3EX59_9AGAR